MSSRFAKSAAALVCLVVSLGADAWAQATAQISGKVVVDEGRRRRDDDWND
jgi:hypothetical protein